MPQHYDAVIVGAGAIGASIACALARRGWRTLNVDRLPTCGYGSTASSSAIVHPDGDDPTSLAMICESHHYWRNWRGFIGGDDVDERGLAEYKNDGVLSIKTRDDQFDPMCEWLDVLGVPFDRFDRPALTERFPMLSTASFGPVKAQSDSKANQANPEPIGRAVYFPQAGYISDPQLATHNIVRAAEAAGAEILYGEKVTGIRKANGRVSGIELENGEALSTGVVVNAAGPHSANVNQTAGLAGRRPNKTRAVRQEVADVPVSDELDSQLRGCVITDDDTGVYMRPGRGNCLLVGSRDPAVDKPDWADPDHFDPYLSKQWKTLVLRAQQRLPSLRMPTALRGVVELYDQSDDGLPIYDKSDVPGFYLAIGTSGKRFSTAPIDGELMADIIESCEQGNDQDSNPVEFHLANLDYTLSSGVFSRLRSVNRQAVVSELA